jgi:oligosaccharide repeat unit polymerase
MGGMIHAYAYRNKGYEDNMAVGDNVVLKSKNVSKNKLKDKADDKNGKELLSENAKKKVKNYIQMYPEFIIATTLPIHMILTFRKIIAMMKGTYFDTFEVGEPGIVAAYSNFFIIGIVLFMLKYRDSFKKVAYTYIATCGYLVMTMLTGSRGKGVIYIIFFTWLACKLLNIRSMKIKKKHIIIAGAIVVLGLAFLSAVSTLRDSGQMDPIHMAKEMVSRNNIVGSTLEEFGGTLYTVAAVKTDVPKYTDHRYGMTYLESLACILPDLGGRFSEINHNAVFLNHFQSDYLGGSIIGEMYFNFGEYGILVAAVLGFIMAAISRRIEYALKNKKYMEFACYVMVFTNSLWWVRDCFNTMCRNVVWAIAYIHVMNFILKKYNEKKSGKANEKNASNNS